jgi:hypothetical protein
MVRRWSRVNSINFNNWIFYRNLYTTYKFWSLKSARWFYYNLSTSFINIRERRFRRKYYTNWFYVMLIIYNWCRDYRYQLYTAKCTNLPLTLYTYLTLPYGNIKYNDYTRYTHSTKFLSIQYYPTKSLPLVTLPKLLDLNQYTLLNEPPQLIQQGLKASDIYYYREKK